jgi:hypothetical protein
MLGLGLGINKFQKKRGLLLAECDDIGDLTLQGCTGVIDESNKVSGNSSIEITKNADIVGYFLVDIPCVYDLTKYKSLKFRFYTADNSNIASISSLFFTTDPFDYGITFVKFDVPVSGWNTIDILFADFIVNGAANWATVKGLRFTINLVVNNATEKVNFDRIEIK